MSYKLQRPTSEQAQETAQKFGVSVEEVYRQWDETVRLGEEGGIDAVMASMGKVAADCEETVDAMVALAADIIDPERDRLTCLGEHLKENIDGVDIEELDKDTLMHALVMATYKLAEAQAKINVLLDGSHRQGGAS